MKVLFFIIFVLVFMVVGFVIVKRRSYNFVFGVVEYVDVNCYVGKWFEIVRFDYRWEKNLFNCMVEYMLMEGGKIKVVNCGFDEEMQIWEESEGKVKFVDFFQYNGVLKVFFFGFLYVEYNIVLFDDDYCYVLVVGKNICYMWIFLWERIILLFIFVVFLVKVELIGLKIEELIWMCYYFEGENCD